MRKSGALEENVPIETETGEVPSYRLGRLKRLRLSELQAWHVTETSRSACAWASELRYG